MGAFQMRWRILQNKWNLKCPPWHDAIGIEEDDEILAVPAVVCWFTRGWDQPALAQSVVAAHNANEK
jgi:hypothetical protein